LNREPEVQVFFNAQCSKCRTVRGLLEERGLEADYLRYLEQAPTRADLERVMELLGIDDPLAMMRVDEPRFRELALDPTDREGLLDAMVAHPILIQRPIVIHGDRAVIARPPDRALELFDTP
jgi:arsenate reductase